MTWFGKRNCIQYTQHPIVGGESWRVILKSLPLGGMQIGDVVFAQVTRLPCGDVQASSRLALGMRRSEGRHHIRRIQACQNKPPLSSSLSSFTTKPDSAAAR